MDFSGGSAECTAGMQMTIRDGVAVLPGREDRRRSCVEENRNILDIFHEDYPIFPLAEGATLIGADMAEALPDLGEWST